MPTPTTARRSTAAIPPERTFDEQLDLLLAQVDALKAVHRAGDAPTFGQVEALFDRATEVRTYQVRRTLGLESQLAPWPTGPWPIERTARRLVELIAHALSQDAAPGKDSA